MKNSCLDSEIMVEIIYNKKSNSKSVKELWTLLLYFFLKSQQFWGEGNNFGKGLWCQLLIFWWVYWKHDGGQETWVSIMIRHGILVIKIHSGRDACSVYSAMNNAYIYIYTLLYTVSTHDPKEIKWAFHHLGMGGLRSNEMRYEAFEHVPISHATWRFKDQ